MTDTASTSKCRKCGKPIFWHKSSRTGKSYPTDSATDRRAFHQCDEQPKPANPQPITPSFEATLEQRVESLEKQVAQLTRTIREAEARQPIGDSEVPF